VAKEAFEFYKKLQTRTDWTLVKQESDGAILHSTVLEGEPINCFRAVGEIAGKTPKEMADLMGNFGLTEWKIMDSDVLDWSVLEQGENHRVYYQENNLPWPLWHRTVVYVLSLIEEDGAYYWVGQSTTHPDKPEEPSKFVRANVTIGLYGFQPTEGGCRVVRVLHVNPSGNIPSSVVNSLSATLINVPKKLANLAKA